MKANWEKILLAALTTGLIGYGGFSTSERTDIGSKAEKNETKNAQQDRSISALHKRINAVRIERIKACRELRNDIIDVLFQPGASIPNDYRDNAERILRRSSC